MSARNSPARRAIAAEPASRQKLRLWLRLLRTTRAIEADLRERLRLEFDSTLPRFDVLAALYRQRQEQGRTSGITMTALSRRLLVSNGNATVIIARLVVDGLVRRTSSPSDRRSTLVELTPEGVRQFRVMADAHERWITAILDDLNQEETDLMMGLLDRMPSTSLTHAQHA